MAKKIVVVITDDELSQILSWYSCVLSEDLVEVEDTQLYDKLKSLVIL